MKSAIGTLLLVSCTLTSPLSGQSHLSVAENDQLVTGQLDEIRDARFDKVPLDTLVEWLSEELGVNVLVHESAVDNNLDQETQLSCQLLAIRTSTMLDLILDPWDCTYTIVDGNILFVSRDYAMENPVTRVLDCSRLLAAIEPKEKTVANGAGGVMGGGLGGGVFSVLAATDRIDGSSTGEAQDEKGSPVPATALATPASPSSSRKVITISPADQLIELIENTVDPQCWEVHGGNSRIRELNGKLVITTTCRNQLRIEALLGQLTPVE